MVDLPECAPGEEAIPAGDGYVCGPADEALPDPVDVLMPVEPVPSVETFPPALPLDGLPEVLAETGVEWLLIAAVAFSLLALGFAFFAARRFAAPVAPRYRRGRSHTRSVAVRAGFTP